MRLNCWVHDSHLRVSVIAARQLALSSTNKQKKLWPPGWLFQMRMGATRFTRIGVIFRTVKILRHLILSTAVKTYFYL